eukprot:c14426_g1_i1.p1 GENE.c14426_g1_i1~~c14426_g1_i1.p1  ORF type:complete len:264 (+),score=30.51 c14426_g1_i1:1386-2177(+)
MADILPVFLCRGHQSFWEGQLLDGSISKLSPQRCQDLLNQRDDEDAVEKFWSMVKVYSKYLPRLDVVEGKSRWFERVPAPKSSETPSHVECTDCQLDNHGHRVYFRQESTLNAKQAVGNAQTQQAAKPSIVSAESGAGGSRFTEAAVAFANARRPVLGTVQTSGTVIRNAFDPNRSFREFLQVHVGLSDGETAAVAHAIGMLVSNLDSTPTSGIGCCLRFRTSRQSSWKCLILFSQPKRCDSKKSCSRRASRWWQKHLASQNK